MSRNVQALGPHGARNRRRRLSHLVTTTVVAGFALTVSLAWASERVDSLTEQRLLDQQTKQAAAVLSSAIMVNQQPLVNALTVQADGAVDADLFAKSMSSSVGPAKIFVSASIWQRQGRDLVQVGRVGAAPAMPPAAASTRAYLEAAFAKKTFTVTGVRAGGQRRIAYALADARRGAVVYAERAIPADGRSPSDSNAAFREIDYAIYLGPRISRKSLTTTDADPQSLPFSGRTATQRVPFGDTVLTLTTTPRRHLGAPLSGALPLILLLAGTSMTLLSGAVGQLLARRRRQAEDSAAYAVGLSERLQRALLPLAIPEIPQLEVAVEYVASARGVDIGGDWYSMIDIDEDRFGFVVGDVSGSGIDAVAVMAQARFTIRAYLLRGDSPDVALSMASHQFNASEDDHIVTAVVGVGDWRTGEITLANAGHCRPLLHREAPAFLDLATGPPLGTGPFTYPATTIALEPGDTVFCYTDGLIERRTENIDTGMDRLAAVVREHKESVSDLVKTSVRMLRDENAQDDIAVLAFRWNEDSHPASGAIDNENPTDTSPPMVSRPGANPAG